MRIQWYRSHQVAADPLTTVTHTARACPMVGAAGSSWRQDFMVAAAAITAAAGTGAVGMAVAGTEAAGTGGAGTGGGGTGVAGGGAGREGAATGQGAVIGGDLSLRLAT